jgi:predicted nucleotidyltransferase
LTRIDPKKLRNLAKGYSVADIYAFGSRAKEVAARLLGEEAPLLHSYSDVDIAVHPQSGTKWGPRQRAGLCVELEDFLGVARVDLVVLTEADPFLALDVIRGELIYTEDPDRQARYELFVLRRAGELSPFRRERVRMILEEGAR